jgi:hypothetical protein
MYFPRQCTVYIYSRNFVSIALEINLLAWLLSRSIWCILPSVLIRAQRAFLVVYAPHHFNILSTVSLILAFLSSSNRVPYIQLTVLKFSFMFFYNKINNVEYGGSTQSESRRVWFRGFREICLIPTASVKKLTHVTCTFNRNTNQPFSPWKVALVKGTKKT